jgi:hypothetical protein
VLVTRVKSEDLVAKVAGRFVRLTAEGNVRIGVEALNLGFLAVAFGLFGVGCCFGGADLDIDSRLSAGLFAESAGTGQVVPDELGSQRTLGDQRVVSKD